MRACLVSPKRARLVLDTKKLFPGGVAALGCARDATVSLSRRQAACLLAHSFLCAWPLPGDKGRDVMSWPPANFRVRAVVDAVVSEHYGVPLLLAPDRRKDLLQDGVNYSQEPSQRAKFTAIVAYFTVLADIQHSPQRATLDTEHILYTRRVRRFNIDLTLSHLCKRCRRSQLRQAT